MQVRRPIVRRIPPSSHSRFVKLLTQEFRLDLSLEGIDIISQRQDALLQEQDMLCQRVDPLDSPFSRLAELLRGLDKLPHRLIESV